MIGLGKACTEVRVFQNHPAENAASPSDSGSSHLIHAGRQGVSFGLDSKLGVVVVTQSTAKYQGARAQTGRQQTDRKDSKLHYRRWTQRPAYSQ